jgi:hypothetical protein
VLDRPLEPVVLKIGVVAAEHPCALESPASFRREWVRVVRSHPDSIGAHLARGFHRASAMRSPRNTKGASDLQGCCLSRAISARVTSLVKKRSGLYSRLVIDGSGRKVVSGAGGVLLTRAVTAVGLDTALSMALARWRRPSPRHDPGKIVLDLARSLAIGGECLADIAELRAHPQVFGPVASDPTVSRCLDTLAADAPAALAAIAAARATARARAWLLAGKHPPTAAQTPRRCWSSTWTPPWSPRTRRRSARRRRTALIDPPPALQQRREERPRPQLREPGLTPPAGTAPTGQGIRRRKAMAERSSGPRQRNALRLVHLPRWPSVQPSSALTSGAGPPM